MYSEYNLDSTIIAITAGGILKVKITDSINLTSQSKFVFEAMECL